MRNHVGVHILLCQLNLYCPKLKPYRMNQPYMIQRAKFMSRPEAKGIDAILRFDYMGSSEFEYGALGDSLRAIRRELDKYDYFDHAINGRPLTIFCKKEDEQTVKEHVNGLAARKFRLKEYCDLSGYTNPEDSILKCFNDHWWDIYNHYMFWKASEHFTEDFKNRIAG